MTFDKSFDTKATGTIAMAVFFSRIFGLIREIWFNALFGTAAMGLYLIAFRIPNLLRDLLAEGALSTSFITVLSKKLEMEGNESAWILASKMLTWVLITLCSLCLLGIVFAKKMVAFFAAGFNLTEQALILHLTQWMCPFILFVSVSALVTGILTVKRIFTIPALASSFFNLGTILGGTLFGWIIDSSFKESALTGLAIGTLIGGLLQLVIQIPSLLRTGFRFKLDFSWRHSEIPQIILLAWPALIAASAAQITVLLNTYFAAYLGKETITWLNSAFRLIQLPIGVFGVAISTVTLPMVSKIAANQTLAQLGQTINQAISLIFFLTLPASVGLLFFSKPIISLIYQHGKFSTTDVTQTALCLQYYTLGLAAYAGVKVLAPTFYSIGKKWAPMWSSLLAIAFNIALNHCFVFQLKLGHCGLALSTSLASMVNFVTLYLFMLRHHRLFVMDFLNTLLRCCAAAILTGIFCWAMRHYCIFALYTNGIQMQAVVLFLAICCATMIYFSACVLFRVEIALNMKQYFTSLSTGPTA